jgi:hypothetical protein
MIISREKISPRFAADLISSIEVLLKPKTVRRSVCRPKGALKHKACARQHISERSFFQT